MLQDSQKWHGNDEEKEAQEGRTKSSIAGPGPGTMLIYVQKTYLHSMLNRSENITE